MLEAFAGQPIRAILGQWNRGSEEFGDNYASYERLVQEGYTPHGAAALTFTGLMAGRHGYMHPVVRNVRPGWAEVIFAKQVGWAVQGRELEWMAKEFGAVDWLDTVELDFEAGAGI